jgi:hypothetical protein
MGACRECGVSDGGIHGFPHQDYNEPAPHGTGIIVITPTGVIEFEAFEEALTHSGLDRYEFNHRMFADNFVVVGRNLYRQKGG